MVEIVAEGGFQRVTIRRLCRMAGISTGTFYKHYANSEACFAATYDRVMGCACGSVASSLRSHNVDWPTRLRDALTRLMVEISQWPEPSLLVLIGAFTAGPGMLPRMELAFRPFEQAIAHGYSAHFGAYNRPPAAIFKGCVAGVARVIRSRLLAGRATELPEAADPLADWILSLLAASPEQLNDLSRLSRTVELSEVTGSCWGSQPLDNDRDRILAATAALGARQGYWGVTINKVSAKAGVSRHAFDAQFASLDECILDVAAKHVSIAFGHAERSGRQAHRWDHAVYKTAAALCASIARTPALAQLAFADIFAPGAPGLELRFRIISRIAEGLQRIAPVDQRPSATAAEASVAAGWRLLRDKIAEGKPHRVPQLAPTAAYFALAPAISASGALQAIRPAQA